MWMIVYIRTVLTIGYSGPFVYLELRILGFQSGELGSNPRRAIFEKVLPR